MQNLPIHNRNITAIIKFVENPNNIPNMATLNIVHNKQNLLPYLSDARPHGIPETVLPISNEYSWLVGCRKQH